MKKITLLACSTVLSLGLISSQSAEAQIFWTRLPYDNLMHVACHNSAACAAQVIIPVCVAPCDMPDLPWAVSMWVDPFMAAATALDALATGEEQTKTVDAGDALDELEESLEGSGSCSGGGGSDTLAVEDIQVLAPEIVVKEAVKGDDFNAVREAVEDYAFANPLMNGDCKVGNGECANQRQETWALLSVSLAEATMDKAIAKSEDMDFSGLASTFNSQTAPMDMWGAMSNITVDTQKRANDLNVIYARELEMTALAGISESGVKKIGRSGAGQAEK